MAEKKPYFSFTQRTIVRDLVIWLTAAICFTVIIQIAVYHFHATHISEQKLNARAESTADELESVLAISVWNLNQNVIHQILNAYLKSPYLAGIMLLDDLGNVMYDQVSKEEKHLIYKERKIFWKDTYVGRLKLWVTGKEDYRSQRIMIRSMVFIGASVFLIVIMVTLLIMRFVLHRPINQLILGIRNIAWGMYQNAMPALPQRDFNAIIQEVNLMASKISKRDAQLNREIQERSKAENELKQLNKTLELRISQLTETEKALTESEKKYRGIFENALEGIFRTTPSGQFIDANPSMAHILGYSSPDELMSSVHDLKKHLYVDPEHREKILEILAENHSISNYECQYYCKDGRKIWVVLQVRAMFDSQGKMTILEGILQDVTERKALQAESLRNARLLSLGELAAGVAHEINNPINGIINYAQILINRNKKQGKEIEIPARIIKEGTRIERIVSSLLSFARERNEKKYRVQIIDIISEALDFMMSMLSKNGIHTRVETGDSLPEIKVNRGQILQVFINIISNARYALNKKYPGTDINKILKITTEMCENNGIQVLRIYFHDTGIGINANKIDRIFDPFFSTKPPNEGTGLGMSISHGIIENHNGKLLVESEVDRYTTIIVELPL